MASSVPLQIAETIQTASINPNPTLERDLAPSTAADTHIPVVLETDEAYDPLGLDSDSDDEAQYSVIRPWDPAVDGPRHHGSRGRDTGKARPHYHLPALPDLRFEQSYLRSISAAGDVWWKVALITVRDQVLMPFVQGLVYNVGIVGWQVYNRRATLSGQSLGAQTRRWWYGVNNWAIPTAKP